MHPAMPGRHQFRISAKTEKTPHTPGRGACGRSAKAAPGNPFGKVVVNLTNRDIGEHQVPVRRPGKETVALVTAVANGRFGQPPIVPHPGRESLHLPGMRMGIPNRLFQPTEETQPAKGMTPKIRGGNRGNIPAPLLNSRLHRRQTDRNVRIRQVQQLHESELSARDPACDVTHHARGNHGAQISFAILEQGRKPISLDGGRVFVQNFEHDSSPDLVEMTSCQRNRITNLMSGSLAKKLAMSVRSACCPT